MSKSVCLRLVEHRALWELVHECRDLGDDPAVWRRHWFAGLSRLCRADLAAGGELAGVRAGDQRNLGSVDWGWDHGFNPAGWQRALELLAANPNYSPQMVEYANRVRHQPGSALSGYDLLGEQAYVRGQEYQEAYRTIGVHHVLWCSRFVPGASDVTNGALFWRAEGRSDFSGREKAVVAEGFALLAPLVGGALARFTEPSPSDLPPRVRSVLGCLLEGDSDKQVAKRLGLSTHTVNQYVKAIFRHFRVGSRPELLARWIKRGWGRGGWASSE